MLNLHIEQAQLRTQGRLQSVNNPLGTFSNTYDAATGLLSQVSRPGGSTALDYYPSTDNQNRGRLQAIRHRNGAQALLDRYTYAYDPAGRITTWDQQRGSDPSKTWTLGYDLADQLLSAVQAPTAGGPAITNQGWHYDAAGNRDQQTIDGKVTDYSLTNPLNELTQVSPKAPVHFEG